MNINKLKKCNYIEIYNLEENKYRSYSIEIIKIEDKSKWFNIINDQKIELTDYAWEKIGLDNLYKKENITFDFIDDEELKIYINRYTYLSNLYTSKINKLKNLQS